MTETKDSRKPPGCVPKKLTDSQLNDVEKLAAVLTVDQLADFLSIGRTTFYRMMERQPDISVRYKNGKAKAITGVSKGLLQRALEGELAAQIFYLKTQAGWREQKEEAPKDDTKTQSQKITIEVVDARKNAKTE